MRKSLCIFLLAALSACSAGRDRSLGGDDLDAGKLSQSSQRPEIGVNGFGNSAVLTSSPKGGPKLPETANGDGGGSANSTTSLTQPPKEYFHRADWGAKFEIDRETLDGPSIAQGDAAQSDSGAVVSDGGAVQNADVAKGNVAALAADSRNLIRAVAVIPVQGAPGSGNQELTEAMRATLRDAGWTVLQRPRVDALTISGEVGLASAEGESQRVVLHWRVATPQGRILGQLEQANAVRAGSLNAKWGAVATTVAQAAATGIFELIAKFR